MEGFFTPGPHRRPIGVSLNVFVLLCQAVILFVDFGSINLAWICFDLVVIALCASYIIWGDRKSA